MHQASSTILLCPTTFVLCTVNSFNQISRPIRMLTQFSLRSVDDIFNEMSKNIMQLYLYTQTDVYSAKISTNNLNRDLNWNEKLLQIMKKSLNGKTKNVKIQFDESRAYLKFWSLFNENDFKILLFSSQMISLHQRPFTHAQYMLKITNQKKINQLKELQSLNSYYQSKLQKMDILSKEMNDQHEFQMHQIKDRFVCLANDVKKKLRPHFGIQQKKEQQGQSQTQTRTLYRIKSFKNGETRQSQNLLNLFE